MAKLTRHKSGITIVTEDFANSVYGGLYGKPEASGLDPADPLVAGHVHDGQHLDGHAQKINLEDHVTGQLDGANIQDGTISSSKLDFTPGGGASGFKFVKSEFIIPTVDKVEASTTSPTPFASKMTIPGNLISAGDPFSITVYYNTYNNTGSPVNYDISIGFGGNTQIIESTSSTGTSDNFCLIGPGGFTGIFPAAGASASAAGLGLMNDDGTLKTVGFAPFTFDSTTNFDFEIYITWDSTATPPSDLYAQLLFWELKIIAAT